MEKIVKIGKRGEITIPKEFRERYGFKPRDILTVRGDLLRIFIYKD